VCPDDDVLVELALGGTDRRAAERLAAHLEGCPACRRSYDDLAGAVELVLPAVPRTSPPPGFEARTLDRLAAARQGTSPRTAARTGTPRAGTSRRTVLLVGAATVLGAASGAGVTAYLSSEQPPSPWSAPLVTADGASVGTVAHSYGERGHLLVVDVTSGPPGRTYTCRLRLTDGTSEDVAEWILADDRPNSWVVEVADPEAVTAVELVASGGAVWARATL
jgi:hypothetical protein